MKAVMKYTIIKSKEQYAQYCRNLEALVTQDKAAEFQDEIELLTLLIQKYDDDNNTFSEFDPIELLRSFMNDHQLKPLHMVSILGISKGSVSDILNYKKGLSKEVIRKLADYFKVKQEAFNRPYKLVSPINLHLRNARVMNTTKELQYTKH